jgi:hypothetical protein
MAPGVVGSPDAVALIPRPSSPARPPAPEACAPRLKSDTAVRAGRACGGRLGRPRLPAPEARAPEARAPRLAVRPSALKSAGEVRAGTGGALGTA